MTNKEKENLLLRIESNSGGNSTRQITSHRLYHVLSHSDLEEFHPDFNNDLDKKIVNSVFGSLAIAIFSNSIVDLEFSKHKLFCLSEFKYRTEKLLRHISHFIKIEIAPYLYEEFLYMKISVADKVRYYQFDTRNFREIKSEVYETMMHRFNDVDNDHIKFLPLTEME